MAECLLLIDMQETKMRKIIFFLISPIILIFCLYMNSECQIESSVQLAIADTMVSSDTLKTPIPFSAQKIAVGGNFSLIVNYDSTLWVSGLNDYGQLGLGDTIKHITQFKKVMTGVCDVAAGTSHSLVLKADGSVWAAGWNYSGEFGTSDTGRSLTFVKVLTNVIAIEARGYCSMAIKRDSTLWVTGKNNSGLLGSGNKNDIKLFVKILSDVCAVSIGSSHTLALKNDGTLWGTGNNGKGQLGWKNEDENGKKLRDYYTVDFVKLLTDVAVIGAGGYHSLALKKDHHLWATGWNEYGQLGTGDNKNRFEFEMVVDNVVSIAGGNQYTLALRTDGILWSTGGKGYDFYPKYGIDDNKKRTMFHRVLKDVKAMESSWDSGTFSGFSLAIKSDGTVWGYGKDGWGVFGRKNLSGYDSWSQLYHY